MDWDNTGMRRHLPRLLIAASLGIATAALCLAVIPPTYASRTVLYVDAAASRAKDGGPSVPATGSADLAIVDSELSVLGSDAMLGRVVETLRLDSDPEFVRRGPLAALRDTLSRAPESEKARATARLADRVRVGRRDGTYILTIDARARTPEKAAQIADTLASLYLADQTEARAEVERRAQALINDQLGELRETLRKAEERADDFKRRNRLTADGAAVKDTSHLAKLNGELARARVAAAEAQARLEAVRKATASANLGALPQAVRSPTIERLRDQLATVARNEASLAGQLKDRHPILVEARSELGEVQAQIRAELKRIANALVIEHGVAGEREIALARTVEAHIAEMARGETAAIKLRELDQDVEASRKMLAAALAKSTEAKVREAVAMPYARIVSPATTPNAPTWPPGPAILGLGALLGLSIGIAQARRTATAKSHATVADRHSANDMPAFPLPRLIDATPGCYDGEPAAALLAAADPPDGRYRQAVLRLLSALDHDRHEGYPLAVMIVDAGPRAGAAPTALALAHLAISGGDRVLLVDASSAEPVLSRLLSPDASPTWDDLLAKPEALAEHMNRDAAAGLAFLPLAHAGLATLKRAQRRELAANLAAAALDFDVVIIDGGALIADESATALLPLADRVAVVAREASTPRHDLADTLQVLAPVSAKIVGLVLNGVDGRRA